MSTQILPTDKSGRVYYGPKTTKEADEAMEAIRETGSRADQIAAERKLLSRIRAAGYTRVAALTKSAWCISE